MSTMHQTSVLPWSERHTLPLSPYLHYMSPVQHEHRIHIHCIPWRELCVPHMRLLL